MDRVDGGGLEARVYGAGVDAAVDCLQVVDGGNVVSFILVYMVFRPLKLHHEILPSPPAAFSFAA